MWKLFQKFEWSSTSHHTWTLFHKGEGSSTCYQHTPQTFEGKQKQIIHGHEKDEFTHFISLPLAIHPKLKKRVWDFKNSILDNKNPLKFQRTLAEMGIEKSIFVSPNTFHLTVVMLKLGDKKSVDKAQNILKSISSDIKEALKNQPVSITLKGLNRLPSGPLKKTGVLYVPVKEVGSEGRLLSACHVIIEAFENAGFAGKYAKSHLQLHATVMNARYRKDKSKKMDTFDAREIHKKFEKKDWGTYQITEAHLSQRYKYDPSGYYHCRASLPFPHK